MLNAPGRGYFLFPLFFAMAQWFCLPDDGAEYDCPHDEPSVPLLLVADGHDAKEQEDDAVGERGDRLDAVLQRN